MNRDTDHISGGGGEGFEKKSKPGEVVVLEQDKLQLTLPGMKWQYISNIGFIDGKFHIQANPEPNMGRFNYGSFYFTDSNGIKQNIANNHISYGGYEMDQIGWGGDYIEYVYDISDISQLKDLKLMGEFTTYTNYFRGKWETSFIMEATTITKQASIHIKDDDAVITRVEVSSLGITLTGEGLNKEGSSVDEITIHYKDGRVIHSESRISSSSKQAKLLYPEIVQIEEVDSVTINGQRVQVK